MPQQREKFGHAPAGAVEKEGGKRLDLTVTQVAASALATVVGAVLASELGVYGTILGAAVVSVGATTGSAVFQQLFKRTGEQLRNAVERGAEPRSATPPGATATSGIPAEDAGKPADDSADISSEWNAPQVLRAKRRWTWKSFAAVSTLVFAVAMVPIVGVELAAGKPLHDITTGRDGGSGTSFNPSRPSGGEDRKPKAPAEPSTGSRPTDPAPSPAPSPSGSASRGPVAPSRSPEPSGSAQPSPGGGGGTPSAGPAPTSAPAATPAGAEAPPTGGAAAN
ncbi:hypothetical protein [Kitasatospora sp. NPDC088134]|uniref:hypothetical protein n=1 Tax=Kitasatospora sp. NPDC088134 TaxID=3364071 RepID=UPI0037F386A3